MQDIINIIKANSHRHARHDKLSCLCRVRFRGVNWIPDNSRLSPTENLKSKHVHSNRPIRIGIRHIRHDRDRTVLSCLMGGVNWAFELEVILRPRLTLYNIKNAVKNRFLKVQNVKS